MSDFSWYIFQGDCLEVLRRAPDSYFDSVVTDPPAGIDFMHRDWDCFRRRRNPNDVGRDSVMGRMSDHAPASYSESDRGNFIAFMTEIMSEVRRVLKPGAHMLVWALPRTSHWTATAIEDAGFEVRDVITHHFGSGFPKSKNLGNGMGTALKPATEHWIMARKSVEKSITANYAQHGTGALNIEACRVHRANNDVPGWHKTGADGSKGFQGSDTFAIREMSPEEIQERCGDKGRWPPNLVLSHTAECKDECAPDCPVAALDRQSGISQSRKGKPRQSQKPGDGYGMTHTGAEYQDQGGASRFFPTFRYQAKPSRSEREAGLDALPARTLNRVNSGGLENEPRFAPVQVKNNHPTVKSVQLMRWLCRLITPPGGLVLDPFCGSGSTGVACMQEGFRFVGIDQSEEYIEIARARISHVAPKEEENEECSS